MPPCGGALSGAFRSSCKACLSAERSNFSACKIKSMLELGPQRGPLAGGAVFAKEDLPRRTDSDVPDPASSMHEIRARVLDTFLRWIAWGVAVIGCLLLLQGVQERTLTSVIIALVAFMQLAVPLRLLARRLGYEVTAAVFVFWLQSIVVYIQIFRGLTAGSALLQVVAVLMATMLFGRRGTHWTLLTSTAGIALAGLLNVSGTVTPIDVTFWDPSLGLVWIRYAVVFLALGGALSLVFARMISQLQSQLLALHQTLARERKERALREAMQAELERAQRFETLALLAGGVAHDLNNGLGVVMSAASLIGSTPGVAPDVQHLADDIMETVTLSADTVRQLLTLGRRDDSKPQPVQLRECLKRLSGALTRVLPASSSLQLEVDPEAAVYIDLARLQRVLLNLTVNARDAMPHGGKVSIEVTSTTLPTPGLPEPSRHFVRIDFRDTGTGMDEATRQRVFEPFFTTKGPGKGTGLGLAMVQTVVQDAGGHVTLSSTVGRGTTVSIFLPSLHAPAAREAEQPSLA